MARETETKFKIDFPPKLRKSLRKIGAKFISKEFERDTYYSLPACRTSRPSRVSDVTVIRLRLTGKKGIFTVKARIPRVASCVYKVRDELEVKITDAETFRKMLDKLRFIPRFYKEKVRETYKWKESKILIDRLPHIGFYAEIEGPKAKIKKAARLLTLDIEKGSPETYMSIFNRYKKLHKKPHIKLIFHKR